MNILVLCTGNSARSILLEAILNRYGADRITAYSAGSQPSGAVHPQSLILLDQLGYDTSTARSKSWDEYDQPSAPVMDVVITVCGAAAAEACPIWPGAPIRAHWGVEDPAAVDKPNREAAFSKTYAMLHKRASALLDVPFETMIRAELLAQLTQIGTMI